VNPRTRLSGEGLVSPREVSPLPNSTSREGTEMNNVPPRPSSRTTSAPTSPLKEKRAGFLGKVTSLSQVVSAKVEQARDKADAIRGFNKDRCFTLLVVDDQNTDWSKYFRGKKLHADWDIKVEQAEFRDLTVSANSESGVSASIITSKAGSRTTRSFKPDFLLVRQNLKDANEDYKSLLLGFQYGGIPSINTLQSIYNFQDRPWVYAHMVNIQKKLGKDQFPLIEQTYYPNHRDMVPAGRYPCVFKIGHAHGGLGKVKVENTNGFQDLASVVAVSDSYCTVETYIEAKYDLHIFKIGSNYRALMRKSLSGQWKTNMGQSILEEVPVTDKYKVWIDAVSEMFGGLQICSLEAVVAKDGKEYIIEVNDSAAGLLGESQEEDRRHIADLVLASMEADCQPPRELKAAGLKEDDRPSSAASVASSLASSSDVGKAKQELVEAIKGSKDAKAKEDKPKDAKGTVDKTKMVVAPEKPKPKEVAKVKEVEKVKPPKPPLPDVKPRVRHDSADSTGSESSTASEDSSASSTVRKDEDTEDKEKPKTGEDGEGEDTMNNLRKTFAGIFGEIQ